MTTMKCPRCHTELTRGTFAAVRVFRCDECSGTALSQHNVLPVLEHLTLSVYGDVSPDIPLPATQDNSPPLSCPDCLANMERHGYMGSKQLLMDSCPDCTMIWLDKDELGAMASMYVRFDKNMRTMRMSYMPTDIVGVHMMSQRIASAFLMGFILG